MTEEGGIPLAGFVAGRILGGSVESVTEVVERIVELAFPVPGPVVTKEVEAVPEKLEFEGAVARVNGTNLMRWYVQDVDTRSVPSSSRFSVLVDGRKQVPYGIATDVDHFGLTFAVRLHASELTTPTYRVPSSNPLRLLDGGLIPGHTADIEDAENDVTPPEVVRASLTGRRLDVVFSERIRADRTPTEMALSGVGFSSARWMGSVLELSTREYHGSEETLELSYDASLGLRDPAGNQLAAFEGLEVDNLNERVVESVTPAAIVTASGRVEVEFPNTVAVWGLAPIDWRIWRDGQSEIPVEALRESKTLTLVPLYDISSGEVVEVEFLNLGDFSFVTEIHLEAGRWSAPNASQVEFRVLQSLSLTGVDPYWRRVLEAPDYLAFLGAMNQSYESWKAWGEGAQQIPPPPPPPSDDGTVSLWSPGWVAWDRSTLSLYSISSESPSEWVLPDDYYLIVPAESVVRVGWQNGAWVESDIFGGQRALGHHTWMAELVYVEDPSIVLHTVFPPSANTSYWVDWRSYRGATGPWFWEGTRSRGLYRWTAGVGFTREDIT